MRKAAIVMLAMLLAGCASQREYLADHIRPQRHVVPAPVVKPAPMPNPTPVVAPMPKPAPAAAKRLESPRWYDEFKASGSWIKSKMKGN